MTKQEKIQEEWIKAIGVDNFNIAKKHINKDGWLNCKWHYFDFLLNNDFLERRANGINHELSQPKSLQGIENNNGWIKIESEADLPINLDCFYWCISKNYQEPWETHGTDIDSKHHTHYQPIQKPKPPIY